MATTEPDHDTRQPPQEPNMGTTTIAPLPRFATRVGVSTRGPGWAWPITVSLHALGAAAVVIVPLLGTEPLPPEHDRVANAFFVSPTFVPPPPPPPPPPAARASGAPRIAPRDAAVAFTAPVELPQDLPADSFLDLGIDGGVPGGVEGGVPGGVVGGIVGGIEAPPPPPRIFRVGGVVREPRKIKDVAPVYPEFAMRARIQGVVILECVISPQGRVENVKVLRGLPTLDEPAVEAVRQWTYTPTLVDGIPASVVMTVTVNFVLRGSAAR